MQVEMKSEATKIQKATKILLRIGPEGVDLYYGGGGGHPYAWRAHLFSKVLKLFFVRSLAQIRLLLQLTDLITSSSFN